MSKTEYLCVRKYRRYSCHGNYIAYSSYVSLCDSIHLSKGNIPHGVMESKTIIIPGDAVQEIPRDSINMVTGSVNTRLHA